MQALIPDFSTDMSWIMLGLACISLALLSLEARRLQEGRRRAGLGLLVMIVVLVATAASLIELAARSSSRHHGPFLSQQFLPLAAAVLLSALYQISFPQLPVFPVSPRARLKTLLLLILCVGAALSASGLVVLDFLFS